MVTPRRMVGKAWVLLTCIAVPSMFPWLLLQAILALAWTSLWLLHTVVTRLVNPLETMLCPIPWAWATLLLLVLSLPRRTRKWRTR